MNLQRIKAMKNKSNVRAEDVDALIREVETGKRQAHKATMQALRLEECVLTERLKYFCIGVAVSCVIFLVIVNV